MSMCASVRLFFKLHRANVCSALHTEIKRQKMQRKKLLKTSFICRALNKQSVEWISAFLSATFRGRSSFTVFYRLIIWFFCFFLCYWSRSLCISPPWTRVPSSVEAAISSLGLFPCDQLAQYILIHQSSQCVRQFTADPLVQSPTFKSDSVV